MSSQQHHYDDEQEQELHSGVVKPFPMHIHKHGLCPPPLEKPPFVGLSTAGDNGAWFDRVPFPSDSGLKQFPSTTSSSSSSIGSANGNLLYSGPDQQSQLVQGFVPFNANVSAGSVEPSVAYHHPYGPSPAHMHHPVQPWTPAFFMLPKTTYEPYGLPGYSYGPNYYPAPISFNAGTGCACPAAPQFGCYPRPPSPNSVEQLLAGHQPLNLSDPRFLHSTRPPHQQLIANSSYGDQMLSHHGYVGSEFQPDFDRREDELDDQIAVGSPEVSESNHDDDDIGLSTVPPPPTSGDGANGTAVIDVTDYESDIVKVACPVLLSSAENDNKPKRKRGRPPKKAEPEVVNHCQHQPHSFSAAQVIGPVDPDHELSEIENAAHQPPRNKMIKSEVVDIKAFGCNPVEPIVTAPDSSDTMKPTKDEKKKFRKPKRQSTSGVKVQLSQQQVESLEFKFQENPFLSDIKDRIRFADKINLSEHRIAVWFQNRRTKERRSGRMPAGPLPEDYAHELP